MSSTGKGKSFAVGAVVGGLLGAVSALLLAPKSGRELRKDIADGYETAADKTVQIAGTVSSKTKEIAKTVSEQSSDWYGKAVELAGSVAEEVKAWKNGRRDLPEIEAAETSTDTSASTESAADARTEAEHITVK